MPSIVRLGDQSQGHSCWPPRPNIEASSNVFANNIGIHRVTDLWSSHCCADICHDGFQSQGSPNVFVNNLQVARTGDAISCGDHDGPGSPNVFANGS